MSMYAIDDLRAALANVRSWSYLASKQLQLEHRRTLIGSAWIVLAFALTSAGIGALMAQLQGRTLAEHVPYVMFGFAAWNFIAGGVVAGSNVLVNAKPYLLQMPTPRTVFVLSLVLRNFYLFLIQLVTAGCISLLFGWRPQIEALWLLPAMMIYLLTAFGCATLLGLVCARMRDLTRLIEASIRMGFFFTPIIWVPSTIRGESGGLIGFIMDWNPLTYILQILRDGLLGITPDPLSWIVALSVMTTLLILAFATLQGFGRRVTYWL